MGRTGINRKTNCAAAQSERILHTPSHGRNRIFVLMEHIMIVELQNKGNLPCKLSSSCFQEPQGCRIGIATGIKSQLKVIVRMIAWRIGGKAPCRPMLEALINRQNHQFASARQPSRT